MRIPLPFRKGERDTEAVGGADKSGRDFAWGFVAQTFSSATNFGLVLIAGRLLGPAGLGMVVIGLGAYQLVVGLQRAFIAQPIVAYAARRSAAERRSLVEAGLTIVLATGAVALVALVVTGVAVGGSIGRAMLIVAPWLVIALLQEFWKAVLFQERLGFAAAASDFARLVVMGLLTIVAVDWTHDYTIVAAWGIAAAAGLLVAIRFFPMQPKGIGVSVELWRRHAADLGLWLGAREVVYQIVTYATMVALALIIGTRDLGGLRSAEALFSPWSLIAAALALPALPALSRAAALSHRHANRLAVKISAGALGLGLAYFLLMALIGPWLLTFLFGAEFSSYDDLVWPMAMTQLAYAATYSFNLLLFAENRGAAAFAAGATWAFATFACATALGAAYGVSGAAWGLAAGAAIGSVLVGCLSVRRPRSDKRIGAEVGAGSASAATQDH
jgi:O-antigen/teichoic acid export membrane protein